MLNGEQLTTLERKLERFARILTEKPNDELTVLALAEASFRRGLRLEALTAYQDVVRKRPVPEAHLAVAEIYQGQKMHSEAYDELRRLFQIDPENVEARMLANILSQEVPPPDDLKDILQEPTSERAFEEAKLRLRIQRTIFNRELQERTRNVTLQPGLVIHEYHVEEAKKRLISVDEQLRHLEKLRDENKTLVSRPRAELVSPQEPEGEVVENLDVSETTEGEVSLGESELPFQDGDEDVSEAPLPGQDTEDSDGAGELETEGAEPEPSSLDEISIAEPEVAPEDLGPRVAELEDSSSAQEQPPVEENREDGPLEAPGPEVVDAAVPEVVQDGSNDSGFQELTAPSSEILETEVPAFTEPVVSELPSQEPEQENIIVEIATEAPLEVLQEDSSLPAPEPVAEDHQEPHEVPEAISQITDDPSAEVLSESQFPGANEALSSDVSQDSGDIMTPFAGDFEFDSPVSPDLPDNDELLHLGEERSLDSSPLPESPTVEPSSEPDADFAPLASLEPLPEPQEQERDQSPASEEQVDEAGAQTRGELETELDSAPEHSLAAPAVSVSPAEEFSPGEDSGQPSEARLAFYSQNREALNALMASSLSRTRGVTSMFLISRDGLCVDAVVNDQIAGETLAELVQQSFEFLETFASSPSYWVLECEGGIFVMQRLDTRHVLIAIGQAGANFGALRYTMDKMKEKFEQLLAQVPD